MKHFVFLVAFISALGVGSASAACFGSGTFQSCTDQSGNSYTVSRFGNSTIVNGNNANTGSAWSQNSQTLGNSTYTTGQTNGSSWSETQTRYGNNMSSVSGVNSAGKPYSYTCSAFGCQ